MTKKKRPTNIKDKIPGVKTPGNSWKNTTNKTARQLPEQHHVFSHVFHVFVVFSWDHVMHNLEELLFSKATQDLFACHMAKSTDLKDDYAIISG